MTSLKVYALLAVADLFGLFVLTWISMLTILVCFMLLITVCVPLLEMTRGFNFRDELGI